MKAKRRIIERIGGGRRYSELTAHPRHDLGKNIADVDFPIVVGYEGKSEIAYNQEELDDILDMITGGPGSRANIAYSLDSLSDMEPESVPAGRSIERYAESKEGEAAPFGSGMEQADLDPDQKEIVGHT